MFNAKDLGKQFIKLVQAKDTDLVEDIVDYDGEDTYLLDCYVDDGEATDYASIDELIAKGIDGIETVDTVTVMGSASGDTRCYSNTVTAIVLDDGTKWMDAAYYDLIFA
jgi:hypothetical protein